MVNRDTGEETVLDAELVVDTTGRSARTLAFLDNLGYERPVQQRHSVRLSYTSQFLRIPAGMIGEKSFSGSVCARTTNRGGGGGLRARHLDLDRVRVRRGATNCRMTRPA